MTTRGIPHPTTFNSGALACRGPTADRRRLAKIAWTSRGARHPGGVGTLPDGGTGAFGTIAECRLRVLDKIVGRRGAASVPLHHT